jgi:hypothetical protein
MFLENRFPPIGSWPEGKLFLIMLWNYSPRVETERRGNAGFT